MKPYRNTIKVDADKFRHALHVRGARMTDASTAIGMSKNYLSARVSEGFFPEYVTKLLKGELDMDRSEYEFKEEQMPIEEPKTVYVDSDGLKTIIYEAVMMALRDTLVNYTMKGGKK